MITNVESGSPADDAGLKEGDLVKEVDRTAIRNICDFDWAVHKARSGDTLSLLVKRNQNTFFLVIPIP